MRAPRMLMPDADLASKLLDRDGPQRQTAEPHRLPGEPCPYRNLRRPRWVVKKVGGETIYQRVPSATLPGPLYAEGACPWCAALPEDVREAAP
jgi:hypothetical protein